MTMVPGEGACFVLLFEAFIIEVFNICPTVVDLSWLGDSSLLIALAKVA